MEEVTSTITNSGKKFRKVVKEANPEALILAEHYGDPSEWLEGDEWDTIMNYDAFMEPVTWFLTGMEKHSDEAREDLRARRRICKCDMSSHEQYDDAVPAGFHE